MSEHTPDDWSALVDHVDSIGRTDSTRELDRPVVDQARLANRLTVAAVSLVVLVTLTAIGWAAALSAQTSQAPTPGLAIVLAAGGSASPQLPVAVGIASTIGGVVYLGEAIASAMLAARRKEQAHREHKRQARGGES